MANKQNLIGPDLDDFVALKCDFQTITSDRYNSLVQKSVQNALLSKFSRNATLSQSVAVV